MNQSPKKIAIIGCAGSGKTFLALKLQEKLKLPLYHLDQYYFSGDWKKVDIETFSKKHAELCEQEAWIIEGCYVKVFHTRAQHADLIIFLDMPRYLLFWQILKRTVFNLGKVLPGSADQCKQRILHPVYFRFLLWVWNFNKNYKENIQKVLDEFKKEKPVYVLTSRKEMAQFLSDISPITSLHIFKNQIR